MQHEEDLTQRVEALAKFVLDQGWTIMDLMEAAGTLAFHAAQHHARSAQLTDAQISAMNKTVDRVYEDLMKVLENAPGVLIEHWMAVLGVLETVRMTIAKTASAKTSQAAGAGAGNGGEVKGVSQK